MMRRILIGAALGLLVIGWALAEGARRLEDIQETYEPLGDCGVWR